MELLMKNSLDGNKRLFHKPDGPKEEQTSYPFSF
jgi:hypothetical protein